MEMEYLCYGLDKKDDQIVIAYTQGGLDRPPFLLYTM